MKAYSSVILKRYFEVVQYYLKVYCDELRIYIVNPRAGVGKLGL